MEIQGDILNHKKSSMKSLQQPLYLRMNTWMLFWIDTETLHMPFQSNIWVGAPARDGHHIGVLECVKTCFLLFGGVKYFCIRVSFNIQGNSQLKQSRSQFAFWKFSNYCFKVYICLEVYPGLLLFPKPVSALESQQSMRI